MAKFIRYFKIFGVTENTSSGTFILASCTYFLVYLLNLTFLVAENTAWE